MDAERYSLEQKVKGVINQSMNFTDEELTNDANLRNDLGVDSLDAVEIIMCIEKKFDISIPDDVVEKLGTVNDIVDYLLLQNIKVEG